MSVDVTWAPFQLRQFPAPGWLEPRSSMERAAVSNTTSTDFGGIGVNFRRFEARIPRVNPLREAAKLARLFSSFPRQRRLLGACGRGCRIGKPVCRFWAAAADSSKHARENSESNRGATG